MVMARSRLKRWISVGACSNSSDASCDERQRRAASVGTRTCSSAREFGLLLDRRAHHDRRTARRSCP